MRAFGAEMILEMAAGLVMLAGLWLVGLGVWMAARPELALRVLGRMGSSPTIHFGEMGVRALIGVGFLVAASVSRFPTAIAIVGGFLIATALILSVLPRRWHAAYSTAWAGRIPVGAVRLIGPVSVIGGGALIWTMT